MDLSTAWWIGAGVLLALEMTTGTFYLVMQALGEKTGIPVTVVPGRGHMLGRDYVGGVLAGWFKT